VTNETTQQINSITTSSPSTGNPTTHGDAIVVHCDGAGCGPNDKGSGIAWIQPTTRQQHVERIDGLTNNQAEYMAFISALTAIPNESVAHVYTDSQLMWSHFIGKYRVHNPELVDLLSQVRTLIKEKNLTIDLQWVRREKNLAGKLL
jgi:ribonuclease HI